MVHKALHYTKRMHPKKSVRWQRQRYFGRFNLDRLDCWTFGDKQTGGYVLKFEWFPIERHILVKGRASPDDPQLKEYWMKRQERQAKDLTISKQKLSKRQKGRCLQCFESLFNGEDIHVHSVGVYVFRVDRRATGHGHDRDAMAVGRATTPRQPYRWRACMVRRAISGWRSN